MGFLKEVYSNNRAGLIVAFGRKNSDNYIETDSVQEAIDYFKMYLSNGEIYIQTEDEIALADLGIAPKEATEAREAINNVLSTIPDEEVELVKILFPYWRAGVNYEEGMRVRFNDNIYKVLQTHTSQDDWNPNVAHSLFAPLLIIADSNGEQVEIPEWIQPDSTNPYMIGDKIRYEGIIYESLIDNNIWSPVEYPAGWTFSE